MTSGTCCALGAAILSLLLACGGGGSSADSSTSSSSSVPTALSVSVEGSGLSWAAFQDGSGTWSFLDLSSGSATLPVHDASGRYGFAMGYVDGFNHHKNTRIWQGTLSEKSKIAFAIPGGQALTLTGSVSGLSGSEIAFGIFGDAYRATGTSTTFSTNCAAGTADFVLVGWDASTGQADMALTQRGKTFSASATLSPIDMSSAQALSPTSVTIPGLSGTAYLDSEYITNNGTYAGLSSPSFTSAPYSLNLLNAAALGSGDIQNVSGEESLANSFRTASTFITDATPLTINLPGSFTGTVTPVSGGFSAQWTSMPGTRVYSGSVQQSSSLMYEYAWVSAGWIGTGSNLSYTIPDLQAFSGWSYTSGQSIYWYFGAAGGSYGLQNAALQPYKKGDSDWGSYATGTFTPAMAGAAGSQAPDHGSEMSAEDRQELRTRLRR